MDTEEVWERIKELKPVVDEEIRKVIPKNHEIKHLYDEVHYHLNTGGKRWRPGLCIMTCEALGGTKEKALPYAAAIEIIHNFSLIHDDIQDRDEYRRDHPTVWKRIGIPRAINVGDGMFAKAFVSTSRGEEVGLSDSTNFKLLKLLSQVVTELTEGQAMDINSRERVDMTEDEYMKMISKKTGALVSGSVYGGALIAGASKEIQQEVRSYGEKIGYAFQIADDLLDFNEGKGRAGQVGNDIREGKRSLMAVHYINNSENPQEFIDILDRPREDTTDKEVEKAIEMLQGKGSLDYARNKVEKLIQEGIQHLQPLPDTKNKEYLIGMAEFIQERDF
ncbi:polyprenyl synthetase family protein [Methanonatronarchaeum sp. AMET6-2]|uniref:polyprenyl synthetase family protein n=1 Tax=Methanonatronarchaeum sp. AMET6-2 TaxID=2933293 RepID=UPI00122451AC|nr:polyprenyl synthetase family protein [Methanonatronarchaeum sp. AMET6-2]RZN61722.1 MAG: polyprenyl synthetase family protein [Methanonatronarchaeia archaeon]UOY10122.1 polyprenyl synthetase family protein [Methanonatronarchaeum sp. AMET6-2]